MSQLKEISSQEHKMEMTPMIDVTFLLLIFFMCTLKFKTLEGKLAAYLPQDVGVNTTDAEPIEKVEILLQVINEGNKMMPDGSGPWDGEARRFIYDDTRQVRYSVGPLQTFDLDKLQARIEDMKQIPGKPKDEIRPATIDPRKGIVYSDVAKVLDVVLSAGFKEVTFVGSYEKQ